jgi:hypothetical protein
VKAKNSSGKSKVQVKTPDGEISLILFSNEKGSDIAGVDLTGAEFEALRSRAKKLHAVLGPCLFQVAETKIVSKREVTS